MVMEVQPRQRELETGVKRPSILLEYAALDDLTSFRSLIEDQGFNIDELGLWYTHRIGSRYLSYEQRTPLMIAALYGSTNVLNYILSSGKVDVNRIAGSDAVSALHCAVAGGCESSFQIVNRLIQSSANVNLADGYGNKAINLIPAVPSSRSSTNVKKLQVLLNGGIGYGDEIVLDETQFGSFLPQSATSDGSDKKEYPVDTSLPDINNGIYSSDEFRMYSFKIKPCSRAYTHDWTECPFSHPGENARRRDPKKHQYSCVPCPEFRKSGVCKRGDDCEYAHGVFESWLHPAQYRTRLCKDEVGCNRKVCFFAHKREELRPVYASTGSAIPSSENPAGAAGGSPVNGGASGADLAGLNRQLSGGLGSPSQMFLSSAMSTPPMSPSLGGTPSSPQSGGGKWGNKLNTPANLPNLQLSGSRLRSSLSARDVDMEMELLRIEKQLNQQQQMQLMENMYGSGRMGELKPTNLDGMFGSTATTMGCSSPMPQSPVRGQMQHQKLSHIRASYPLPSSSSSLCSSPVAPRKLSPPKGLDSPTSKSVAAAAMLNNSRAAAFAKQRSHSFIDRGAAAVTSPRHGHGGGYGNTMSANVASEYWGSHSHHDGSRLDWGVQQGNDDMNMNSKLRKSASFGFRGNVGHNNQYNNNPNNGMRMHSSGSLDEPDVSWVNSLVKDVPPPSGGGDATGVYGSRTQRYGGGSGGSPWVEQLYREQEQMVA